MRPCYSDTEECIKDNLHHSDASLDLSHAVKETLFRMWMDGAIKNEREEVSDGMNEVLCTLVNSVKRHLNERDMKRLSKRIESTTGSSKKICSNSSIKAGTSRQQCS